jgi:hypothetical protein
MAMHTAQRQAVDAEVKKQIAETAGVLEQTVRHYFSGCNELSALEQGALERHGEELIGDLLFEASVADGSAACADLIADCGVLSGIERHPRNDLDFLLRVYHSARAE